MTSLNSRMIALAVSAVLAVAAPAQGQARAEDATRTRALDTIMARFDGARPGCAVGVAQNGRTVMTRAWGLAELEHGAPATADTIYEAGSVSKQFTAAAILILAHEGKLNLDDDIRKYLPEMPDYGAPIRLRNLMNHTSGVRDWGAMASMEGWPRGLRAATNTHALEITARQRGLNFQPGERYLYSNTGYNLLTIIVERVSGQSLADFTRDRIFSPLGMAHTRWRNDFTAVVSGRANAYSPRADGFHLDMPFEDTYGHGGLLTTVADLLKWNAALDADSLGVSRDMLVGGVLKDGTRINYGGGLRFQAHHGFTEIAHAGATAGYRAWLGRYPDQKVSVAVLCNTTDVTTLTLGRQVADLYLPAFPAEQAYVPTAPAPVGLYVETTTGAPFVLAGQGTAYTADGAPLHPVGPGRWKLGEDELVFRAEGGFDRLTTDGQRVFYRPQAPSTLTAADMADYQGLYVSDEAQGRWRIATAGDGLTVAIGVWPSKPLRPVYGEVFSGEDGTVSFERDLTGKVVALSVNNGRAMHVRFARQGD